MPNLKKAILFACAYLFAISNSFSQTMNYTKEDPTDFMNGNGKIYVVMTVVIVIVIGLFLYLINLDRKMNKLEKR